MQDEVNQDYSEQNEVDGMKKGAENKCNCYRQGSLLAVSDTNWQRLFTFWQNTVTEACMIGLVKTTSMPKTTTTLVSLRKISYISLCLNSLTDQSWRTQSHKLEMTDFHYFFTYIHTCWSRYHTTAPQKPC